MKLSKVFVAMATLALVMTTACGKSKSDSGSANVSAGSGLNTIAAGTSDFPRIPFSAPQAVAVTSPDRNLFNDNVKALVSSSVDPQYVGDVDNVSGVLIRGNIAINLSTGDIMTGSNYGVQLDIRDSYSGQLDANGQVIEPISIFVPSSAGRAAKGQVSLQFTDSYGSIFINGTYSGVSFTGKVSFQNTRGSGYKGITKGDLGQFTVPTCSFFRCM